jgi:hypothetical protein
LSDMDCDLELKIMGLCGKLEKVTRSLRLVEAPGLCVLLSVAELFASKRAAKLPAHVHALWNALNALEAQTIGTPGGYPYAKPCEEIFALSDKCHAAVKAHGHESPQHDAARKELHDAMYDGGTREEYDAVLIQKRREAANIGY